MPFGLLHYVPQFVTLLAAPTAFVRAATCVLHATSFISSFVTLHYTSFIACHCCKAWHTCHTQIKAQVMHIPFRKPTLQYSLGSFPLHYVLYSFQSHSVHPLPISLLISHIMRLIIKNRFQKIFFKMSNFFILLEIS